MKTIDVLDATAAGIVCGRHSIWAPELGLKIPFQWSGQLTKYRHSEAGHDPADTIPHELAILRALAAESMAPTIGELVRIETLISEHPGAYHADPVGCWAYEMADATKLPSGRFSIERMKALPIAGSTGAWGDVAKPGNVVNGYLVDVRRTAWDNLRWTGSLAPLPAVTQDLYGLKERVHRECQFPQGARSEAYQDFWIGGQLERGQRRVIERAEAMGFRPQHGDSVLDIGAQSGGFLQFAARAGASRVAGVELEPRYIDCARALARSSGRNICIRQMDVVAERDAFISWARAYFPGGRPTHCLALSLEKHIGERFLFELLDEIGAQTSYVETNAVPTEKHLKMWEHVEARRGSHVGFSRDRNLRALYQIGVL